MILQDVVFSKDLFPESEIFRRPVFASPEFESFASDLRIAVETNMTTAQERLRELDELTSEVMREFVETMQAMTIINIVVKKSIPIELPTCGPNFVSLETASMLTEDGVFIENGFLFIVCGVGGKHNKTRSIDPPFWIGPIVSSPIVIKWRKGKSG